MRLRLIFHCPLFNLYLGTLHHGIAIFLGPAIVERTHLKKTGTVKPQRSRTAKNAIKMTATTKVHNLRCNKNNKKGKTAFESIGPNRADLAVSRQCASILFTANPLYDYCYTNGVIYYFSPFSEFRQCAYYSQSCDIYHTVSTQLTVFEPFRLKIIK